MKKGKKVLSTLLCIALLLTMVNTTAYASSTNVELTVDKTTANIGEKITVVVQNNAMMVSSFATGFYFDKDKLTCKSIVGPDSEYPDSFGL